MTIKEQITQELEKLPEPLLQEILDFIQFLHDLWIAAVALQHNFTVISADSDFQRIIQVKALSVESWL